MTIENDIACVRNRLEKKTLTVTAAIEHMVWLNKRLKSFYNIDEPVIIVKDHNPPHWEDSKHCLDFESITISLHLPDFPPLKRDFSVLMVTNGEPLEFIGHVIDEITTWSKTMTWTPNKLRDIIPSLPEAVGNGLKCLLDNHHQATTDQLFEARAIATSTKTKTRNTKDLDNNVKSLFQRLNKELLKRKTGWSTQIENRNLVLSKGQ